MYADYAMPYNVNPYDNTPYYGQSIRSVPNYYGQPVKPPMPAPQPQSSLDILWLTEEEAKAYPLAPGHSVLIMDKDSDIFYIKTTDNTGRPLPMKKFSYTEIKDANEQQSTYPIQAQFDPSEYVTKDELDKKIAELGRRYNGNNKKGDRNNEQSV